MPPPPRTSGPSRRTLAVGGAATACVLVLAVAAVLLLRGSGGPPSKTSSIYGDDFSNIDSGWSGTTWSSTSDAGYFGGGYRLHAGGANSTYTNRWEDTPYKNTMPERVLVSADARQLGGPDYGKLGLFCRGSEVDVSSDAAMYQFLVRADGKGVLIRKLAGKSGSKELANQSSASGFKKGQNNSLQAACEKQDNKVRLRLWINGDLAAEATDADRPLPTGVAGLMAAQEGGGSGGAMQALYDNFQLAEIR
jgi:hypothetical protein